MRFQLTLYTLGLVLLWGTWVVSLFWSGSSRPRSERGKPPAWQTALYEAFLDAMWPYAPFGLVAVMMLLYGKPGRPPQLAGWAVVVLAAFRVAVHLAKMRLTHQVLTLLTIAALFYLWFVQLPLFDTLPP